MTFCECLYSPVHSTCKSLKAISASDSVPGVISLPLKEMTCLMLPKYCLNLCWFIISRILQNSYRGNSTKTIKRVITTMHWKIRHLKSDNDSNRLYHNGPWWRHQMETFSALLAICAGNSPVTGEFPAQRPVTRSFDVFFDLRRNKWLSKLWWIVDLRRHRTHYDVIVMQW